MGLVLSLLGELGLDRLLPLLQLALGLEAHDASAPLPLEALVELRGKVVLEGVELAVVLLVHLRQADRRRVLLVHQGAEASLKRKGGGQYCAWKVREYTKLCKNLVILRIRWVQQFRSSRLLGVAHS